MKLRILNTNQIPYTIAIEPPINMTQLRAFPVPVPPVELQRRFAEISGQHERLRAQQHEAARQAEQLFGALLGRAFRGEL